MEEKKIIKVTFNSSPGKLMGEAPPFPRELFALEHEAFGRFKDCELLSFPKLSSTRKIVFFGTGGSLKGYNNELLKLFMNND